MKPKNEVIISFKCTKDHKAILKLLKKILHAKNNSDVIRKLLEKEWAHQYGS